MSNTTDPRDIVYVLTLAKRSCLPSCHCHHCAVTQALKLCCGTGETTQPVRAYCTSRGIWTWVQSSTAQVCNPSSRQVETGGSLELLASYPHWMVEFQVQWRRTLNVDLWYPHITYTYTHMCLHAHMLFPPPPPPHHPWHLSDGVTFSQLLLKFGVHLCLSSCHANWNVPGALGSPHRPLLCFVVGLFISLFHDFTYVNNII